MAEVANLCSTPSEPHPQPLPDLREGSQRLFSLTGSDSPPRGGEGRGGGVEYAVELTPPKQLPTPDHPRNLLQNPLCLPKHLLIGKA
jgi:hypothetical protein